MTPKLIQFYFQKIYKKDQKGFTLIELMIAIAIIGILSAIALPSFLNQIAKARQVEAKQFISTINTSQQLHYIENGRFITSSEEISALGINLPTESENNNYRYNISASKDALGAIVVATPKQLNASYRSYVGGIGLIYEKGSETKSTTTIICEANNQSVVLDSSAVVLVAGEPQSGGGKISCTNNSKVVK